MIKYIKILGVIVSFFVLPQALNAQDYRADLIKVYEKMKNASFKMELQMKMKHWDTSVPTNSLKGVVRRKADNYYTSLAGRITLKNAYYHVLITEGDKIISYVDVQKLKGKNNPKEVMELMNDTSLFNNVTLVKSDASGKLYESNNPSKGISRIQIKISHENTLKEVKYFYKRTKENPIKEVVITYNKVEINPKFTAFDFSEKKYFKKINGKEVLTAAYKGYTLANAGNFR